MDKTALIEKYWDMVGDDKLFPNHTDKDVWINGFLAGLEAFEDLQQQKLKKYQIDSWNPKFCKIVYAENSDEALAKVLGRYGGDQGYSTATEIL